MRPTVIFSAASSKAAYMRRQLGSVRVLGDYRDTQPYWDSRRCALTADAAAAIDIAAATAVLTSRVLMNALGDELEAIRERQLGARVLVKEATVANVGGGEGGNAHLLEQVLGAAHLAG